jgi:hypothetical protein
MDSTEGIYRKVFVSMWGDAKFRSLSSAPPNAQTLWIYLLTGEHTNQIPGLSTAGASRLAEDLTWPIERFRRCWAEIADAGMAHADWDARVVWVPNAIRYNQPVSPNVVKSWAKTWRLVAQCELKERARRELHKAMRDRGPPFLEAFMAACPPCGVVRGSSKPSAESLAAPSPNQEQDREQQQQLERELDQATGAESEALGEKPHDSGSGERLVDVAERLRLALSARLGRANDPLPWSENRNGARADEVRALVGNHVQRLGLDCALFASLAAVEVLRSPLRSMAPLPDFLTHQPGDEEA